MGPLDRWFVENQKIPWRVRQGIHQWVFETARIRFPTIFRLALLGRYKTLARPVTSAPGHHFFGYYDKSPWSRDERRLLAHRIGFMNRAPGDGDPARIGFVDLQDNDRWHDLAITKVWNWQQGAMLRWHPTMDDIIVYNDRQSGRFVTRFFHCGRGNYETLDWPLYAISPKGNIGYSVNFARLQTRRPGYGYAGIRDPWQNIDAPEEDGVWRIDLSKGKAELIVSLADLAGRNPRDSMSGAPHWVNHVQVSPTGQRFLFLHRWGNATAASGFYSRLYCADADGTGLKCLMDYGHVSHYDWMDDETLVVWAEHPLAGERFYLIGLKDSNPQVRVFGQGILQQDGHCNFSPDRKWLVTDTYPDRFDLRKLLIYRLADGKQLDLELFYSPRDWPAEIRCDLHPRWSPSGTHLCIDSMHQGTRQLYLLDIKRYLR